MERYTSGARPNGRDTGPNGPAVPHTAAAAAPPDDEVSLHLLAQRLLRDKWLVFGVFLAVLAVAALVTALKAPVYEAGSLLYVDSKSSTPQLGQMLGLNLGENDVANEVEILKSRTMAEAVATRLLALTPAARRRLTVLDPTDEGTPPTRNDLVDRLREQVVRVAPLGREVDMVRVTAESTSPAEAALVANLYAEEYTLYNRRLSRQRFSASREFLDDQVTRFDSTLRTAEGDLVGYATSSGAVAPELEAQQLLDQVGNLEERRTQLEVEATTTRREISALEGELRRLSPELATRIASDDDAVIAEYKRNVAEAQGRLEVFYAANPDLRGNPQALAAAPPARRTEIERLQTQVQNLTREINTRSARIVEQVVRADGTALPGPSSVVPGASASAEQLRPLQELSQQVLAKQVQLAGLESGLGIVQRGIATYSGQLQRIPGQSVSLDRLRRQLGVGQETYVEIVKQLNQARIAEQSELGYVTIVDRAALPDEPVSPRVPLNLLLGSLLGLMLGVGLVLARSAFDTRVRSPEDVRRLGLPILTVVPDMSRAVQADFGGRETITVDGHTFATSLFTILNPGASISESYRRLRTSVQYANPDRPPRVLVVTSAGPGEGKSVTALNLAAAIAQAGHRVAYVDADLRRPSGHKMMGVPREPGLTDLLFEGHEDGFEGFAAPADDLYLIPAGSKVANPAEVLASQRMRELVGDLRRAFDYVVVDTPPVLAVTDSLVVAGFVDAILIVCSAGETTQHTLGRSVEMLRDVNAPLIGVVLNRFDARAAYGGYGYGYGYGYAYEYSEASEPATP